ncbi:MAG: GNAT family N-acetyltransferase [Paludibacter sp.]|nr:GNAT family N-acetyltransferase [Paludibacter sp.]
MVSVECNRGLPLKYESFLIKKYDSSVVTCRYIDVFLKTIDIHHLLIYEDQKLTDILIFDINGDIINCLNTLTFLSEDSVNNFKKYIFCHFPNINSINFPSSYSTKFSETSILTLRSEDFIIDLPNSINDYFKQLGSSTRSNVRKHKNKFSKNFPQANFVTKTGSEIEEKIIDKIINLNFNRIKSKGEIPHVNSSHVGNYYKFAQQYGCVTYIEIDGEIIAGCIAFMAHKSIYSYFLAHDNNYSKYNAGQLSMLHLIQTSIERGFTQLHLLWGESDYKTRFLAKPRGMYSFVVYKFFTFQFVFNKMKEFFTQRLYRFKKSKYSIPIRNLLKSLKKKNLKQISMLEY